MRGRRRKTGRKGSFTSVLFFPKSSSQTFSSLTLLLAALCLGGCAGTAASADKSKPASVSHVTNNDSVEFASGGHKTVELQRLTQLWQKRTQGGTVSDYPIGPGDVLEISVPAAEELSSRAVRVSGAGTISLPLIGVVRASGLTEAGLEEEIRRRLEKDYLHNPQVNLFVREYRSRQVAVIGAVAQPGLYSLASGADTILNVLSMAGGMTAEAAPRIHFIPAEPVEQGKAQELASALPMQLVSKDPSPLILKSADPIVIDIKSLTQGGNQIYLSLPVRPGDVIMVPGSGEVLVEGWVTKPGSYKITPGLTILGAVAAAGGPLFPANTGAVKVIRTGKEGEKSVFLSDLEKVKRREEPDMLVQEGDVIEVASSAPKLIPYGFYRFFSSVLHVGATMPLY